MISRICILILILLLSGCTNSQPQENEWIIKAPEETGIQHNTAESLITQAKALSNIYSFLVIKDGAIVIEQYMNGADKSSLLHIRSITKSISSILIGVAINEGLFGDTGIMLKDYYPEYVNNKEGDYINDITLEHIIDMQSGFEWEENKEAINWYTRVTDTWSYIFNREVINKPGTKFNYNSGSASLINRFIDNNNGEASFIDFVNNHLFTRLNIISWKWEKDGIGNYRSDAGLQLTARDLAKVGYMYLNEGLYQNSRLVSESWVKNSWSFDIDLNSSYGKIENLHYNNFWWMGEYKNEPLFFALGYGGQLLICVPGFDLVVVTNHEFRLDSEVVNTHSAKFINQVFVPLLEELIQ